jgi:predicted Zn finger-like uncharacterized protein
MSLATRCSACGTVFRVVQDQLKVSEGWVRCGRCQEVFNAVEGLFDLDREAPPTWPQQEEPGALPTAHVAPDAADAPSLEAAENPLLHTEDASQSDGFADARFHSELPPDTQATDADSAAGSHADRGDDDAGVPTRPPAEEPTPHFMRAGALAERWEHPRRRAGLWIAAVVLGFLLAAQVGILSRTHLSARWPATRPVLNVLCSLAACKIEAPRRLDVLAVDSSGLVRLDAQGVYRFELVLRNRAAHDVMLPALELTLTDASGSIVTRKVVSPTDLNARSVSIAAASELPLNALLAAGDARITGYTVDLFYP